MNKLLVIRYLPVWKIKIILTVLIDLGYLAGPTSFSIIRLLKSRSAILLIIFKVLNFFIQVDGVMWEN